MRVSGRAVHQRRSIVAGAQRNLTWDRCISSHRMKTAIRVGNSWDVCCDRFDNHIVERSCRINLSRYHLVKSDRAIVASLIGVFAPGVMRVIRLVADGSRPWKPVAPPPDPEGAIGSFRRLDPSPSCLLARIRHAQSHRRIMVPA